MIEELQAILELLGDMTGIAGWVFGGWLAFKAIILLSTTGAIVYLTSLGINRLSQWLELTTKASVDKDKISKQVTKEDIIIKGMCIIDDGAYDFVVDSLKRVKNHVNAGNGSYIHSGGANWLHDAVAEKIERDNQEAKQ